MHYAQVFLLVLVILLILNVPTFVFGLLVTKCALYLCPLLKKYFIIRWVFPVIAALMLMLFGVGVAFHNLEQPWPTRPVLSGWECSALLCVLDIELFVLWARLKQRELRGKSTALKAKGGENILVPTMNERSLPKMIENMECDTPVSRTAFAAFREGFMSPWTGWHYMWQHPSLWRYGLMPLIMNLLVAVLLLAVLIALAGDFIVAMHPNFPDGWLWRVLEVLAALAVLIGAIGVSAVIWVILQGVFCGHFYSKLAEQVELQLGMKREDIQEVPFTHQIRDTLSDAGFLTGVNVGLLMLHCVPGIGSIISAGGSYYFTCMTFGLDYFEHPLALRGKRRSEMRAFAHRHRAHTLGLGTGVAVVSLMPLVNAVLLTTVVVGAVLLHRRLARDDENKVVSS
jgi:CysZ protein